MATMHPIAARTRAVCSVVGSRLRRSVPRQRGSLGQHHRHHHHQQQQQQQLQPQPQPQRIVVPWEGTRVQARQFGSGQTCVAMGIATPRIRAATATATATPIRASDLLRNDLHDRLAPLGSKRSQSTHASNDTTTATTTAVNNSDIGHDDAHRYRYELYQYKICPFSNMAKAYLEHQKIPYRTIEVNPLTKAELGFSKDYRKVPIVRIIDTDPLTPATSDSAVRQLNGTEEILAFVPNKTNNQAEDPSSLFADSESSRRWQEFARTKLAPLLYPNICRSLGDSFRAFGYVHDDANANANADGSNHFSLVQRISIQCVGSVAMYFAASKILKKYGIENAGDALRGVLEELEEALALSRRSSSGFLGGSSTAGPDLGDLAVFGVFRGLEGLPLFASIMDAPTSSSSSSATTASTATTTPDYPRLREWYASVGAVVERNRLQTPRYGYND